ncbi:beta-ketoacyl synthase N-terminal-like domain-containing protein [Streptomyces prasinus]|uniref:beta-ketoacyl synthase N-terminal-like domain-containing protein n=1 Tax=Streptomyces prasinus TaxID=67345 RepID=UPI0033B5042E
MDIREILVRYKEGSLDRGSASQLLGALTVGEFGTVPSPEAPEALKALEVPVAVEERVSGGLADTDADVVAVVGMAGRYPRAADLDAFWQNVSEGRDTSAEAPADRPGAPLLGSGERGHFLDAVDEFDPEFFGLTEDEGRLMDPQERLFLETAWEALEDAGCTGSRLDALTGTGGRPRAVGVFAADYLAALWRSGHVERLTGLWLSGVEIDWFALEGGPYGGRRHAPTPLPPSVFLRRPLWLEPDEAVPVSRERRG